MIERTTPSSIEARPRNYSLLVGPLPTGAKAFRVTLPVGYTHAIGTSLIAEGCEIDTVSQLCTSSSTSLAATCSSTSPLSGCTVNTNQLGTSLAPQYPTSSAIIDIDYSFSSSINGFMITLSNIQGPSYIPQSQPPTGTIVVINSSDDILVTGTLEFPSVTLASDLASPAATYAVQSTIQQGPFLSMSSGLTVGNTVSLDLRVDVDNGLVTYMYPSDRVSSNSFVYTILLILHIDLYKAFTYLLSYLSLLPNIPFPQYSISPFSFLPLPSWILPFLATCQRHLLHNVHCAIIHHLHVFPGLLLPQVLCLLLLLLQPLQLH